MAFLKDRHAIVGALFLVAVMQSAHADALRTIEMDQQDSRLAPTNRPNVGPQIIDGGDYITTTYDSHTAFRIWRSEEAFRGHFGIGLRIDKEDRQDSPKSKIEINVSRHDDRSGVLTNGEERYLGFALKLDSTDYESPFRWVLLFQVWQCCAFQPPLALQGIPSKDPSAPLRFSFVRRTDANTANQQTSDNGKRTTLINGQDTFTLERGRWYRFVLRLKPGPKQNSGFDVWLDGIHLAQHFGTWGYTPRKNITDKYAVKLGIYRHAQPTSQQIYLDSIRWGLSRDDVDPDRQRAKQ